MPAARVETLQPDAYLEEYEGRPPAPIVIGLRTPNEEDYAAALACETDEDAVLLIVSTGICDPNDCRKRHPAFPLPDIQVKNGLKPLTIRYLYDRITILHIETSPAIPLATDEDLFVLGDELQGGERLGLLESDSLANANRIRRLAAALLAALGMNDV
jgi:hypothetical protein